MQCDERRAGDAGPVAIAKAARPVAFNAAILAPARGTRAEGRSLRARVPEPGRSMAFGLMGVTLAERMPLPSLTRALHGLLIADNHRSPRLSACGDAICSSVTPEIWWLDPLACYRRAK